MIAFLVFFLGIPSPISKMGGGFKENDGGGRGNECVWEGGGEPGDGRAGGERLPGAASADSAAGLRAVRGDLMAQAPDSPSAVLRLLRHAPPHQTMRWSILLKPLGYFTSILSPLLPPRPPTPLSRISAIPPPSAGSKPPKGRLPSPLGQVAAARGAGQGRLQAQLLENPCLYL